MSVTNAARCEAVGTQWERTRNLTPKKPSVCLSSLTDADINFFEKGITDLCELQQSTWAPLPKLLVVDSGAGETVMPGLVDKPSFDRVRWVKSK